jgi:uncharacterized RDD family membrane protein YckC
MLATWGERFWAWLIDVIIIGIIQGIIFAPFFFTGFNPWHWGTAGIISLIYWSVLDMRQSVGKLALSIKVVKKDGSAMNIIDSAIQAFGKAFLLPLDCLIGWLFMPNTKLRLFNRLSDTIVIKLESKTPKGIRYVRRK